MTLARIANDNIRELRERIANMKNSDFGSFDATEFHLYLSRPTAAGSVYTPLATFPLAALAAILIYQGTNAGIYYLVAMVVYFWAYSEGEVCVEFHIYSRSSRD